MPSYKLTYFDGRGKAEVSRQMFKLKQVDFEDVRISHEEWPQHKADQPFGALPVLEVDGVKICQSQAIERLLASRFGLYGSDDMEQAKADMIVGCGEDFVIQWFKILEGSDEEKAEKRKKFLDDIMPTMMSNLEKMVSPQGFFLGKEMMWPDIYMAHLLSFPEVAITNLGEADISQFPKLVKIKNMVESHPNIAQWIKERPETSF